MRARRAIWIAGGVVALGVGVLLLMREPGRVSAQVLGETNGYRTVIIRNGTPHLYHVLAWGEFYSNDVWERLSLSNTFDKVEPGRFIDMRILMPTNTPRRLAFVYRPVRAGPLAVWINRVKTRLRLKPEVKHVYMEVE
jgi:hypothetical protein